MDVLTLREYESLSPFEIKDFLAKAALKTSKAASTAYLNAGRGNPNWIATEPREAFFFLGQFAITESKRVLDLPAGVGGMPRAQGIADRLEGWLRAHRDSPGARFLGAMVPWAVKKFGFEPDKFVHELVDSIIGDNYPVPDRMLVHNERIVHEYLMWAMCGDPRPAGKFDLYAVDPSGRGVRRIVGRRVDHIRDVVVVAIRAKIGFRHGSPSRSTPVNPPTAWLPACPIAR